MANVKIAMIAAMANNRVIGADNAMPWHLPADLAHFKRTTLGKPVIMGRKTYESIGRALPGRLNIVITRDDQYSLEDATVVHSPEEALALANEQDTQEVMIIGGGNIYQQFLPQASTLYLTFIDLDVAGDTQFPDYEASGDWDMSEEQVHTPDDKNQYGYRFVTLQRSA